MDDIAEKAIRVYTQMQLSTLVSGTLTICKEMGVGRVEACELVAAVLLDTAGGVRASLRQVVEEEAAIKSVRDKT